MSNITNQGSKRRYSKTPYQKFWNWFEANEKKIHKIVKSKKNLEQEFFDLLSPKLNAVMDGLYFVTGMYDDNTAELIITPEGNVSKIYFVENLIRQAPKIKNWRFTALKPGTLNPDQSVKIGGHSLNQDSLRFFAIEEENYPDKINITIVYENYKVEDQRIIVNGVHVYLDNLLGEMNAISIIDKLNVKAPGKDDPELIPILKLKNFLYWRQKEFVEKYEGTIANYEKGDFRIIEAKLANGLPLFATMNFIYLNWDAKSSHPWMCDVLMEYKGNERGLPSQELIDFLFEVEDELTAQLPSNEGYLKVGNETADHKRILHFACKDFRKPTMVTNELKEKYKGKIGITFDAYKDKYWESFQRFIPK